jgi:uncharacterized SAM-binding protein YcdF (DUF218 family)
VEEAGPAPERRRPPVAIAVALAVGGCLLVIAQVALFLLPKGERPHPADAIVVLGGPGDRIERSEDLAREGFASTVVLMTPTPDNCEPDVDVRQLCLSPRPRTTQGEARAVGHLVRQNDWKRVLVVVQNEQVVRAGIRLDRCLPQDVEITMVAVRASALASLKRVVYETGALPKALLLQRGC